MPTLNILPAGVSINDAFTLVTNIEQATIATASSTEIFLFINSGFIGTFTIFGFGLTTTTIGGVEYINGGTVTGIRVVELGTIRYEFTDLALSGAVLGAAMVADREATNNAAVENLFSSLTYTINGRTLSDVHLPTSSFEFLPINLTGNNTYFLDDGADSVTAAGSGNDTIHGGNGADSLLGNDGNDSINGDGDSDSLYGGNGNDTLNGGAGIDSLFGGDNDDVLFLFGSGGRAEGGEGDDYVSSAQGTSTLYGDSGNDTLSGELADNLYGGSGNDSLLGVSPLSSILIMHGEDGNDTLNGTFGGDLLYGGADDDVINGLAGYDDIFGGDGNDLITATGGFAHGDFGNDTINAVGSDTVTLRGNNGEDLLTGNTNANQLFGDQDNDTLFGGGGADNLEGGDGNDQLAGGTGGDTLNGGLGTRDLAIYDEVNHGHLVINLENATLNTGAAAGDSYIDIEGVIGGTGDDTITGNTGDNYLVGGFGYDSVYGGDGNDTLLGGGDDDGLFGGNGDDRIVHIASLSNYDGGIGNDTLEIQGVLFGAGSVIDLAAGTFTDPFFNLAWTGFENYVQTTTGASSEQVYGTAGDNLLDFSSLGIGSGILAQGRQGNDTIYGSAGNDTLIGGAGADVLNGGAGLRDLASYVGTATGVRVDLTNAATNTGIAAGDTFSGIEDLLGSNLADTLIGDAGNNQVSGAADADALEGRVGADTLDGGSGNDTLTGGAGADSLIGGDGTRDLASYWSAAAGVRAVLIAPAGNTGDAAGDTYSGIEDIGGSAFNDVLGGDNAANRVSGNNGNDALDGAGGADSLFGDAGNDTLVGGAGADALDGGAGTRDMASYWNSAVGLRAVLLAPRGTPGMRRGTHTPASRTWAARGSLTSWAATTGRTRSSAATATTISTASAAMTRSMAAMAMTG